MTRQNWPIRVRVFFNAQFSTEDGVIDAPRSLDFPPQSGQADTPRVLLLQVRVQVWQTGDNY